MGKDLRCLENDLQICVTCLSSESVESRATPIFFAEAEEVTDEVATLMLTEEGSGTVLSIENQHLRLITSIYQYHEHGVST